MGGRRRDRAATTTIVQGISRRWGWRTRAGIIFYGDASSKCGPHTHGLEGWILGAGIPQAEEQQAATSGAIEHLQQQQQQHSDGPNFDGRFCGSMWRGRWWLGFVSSGRPCCGGRDVKKLTKEPPGNAEEVAEEERKKRATIAGLSVSSLLSFLRAGLSRQ